MQRLPFTVIHVDSSDELSKNKFYINLDKRISVPEGCGYDVRRTTRPMYLKLMDIKLPVFTPLTVIIPRRFTLDVCASLYVLLNRMWGVSLDEQKLERINEIMNGDAKRKILSYKGWERFIAFRKYVEGNNYLKTKPRRFPLGGLVVETYKHFGLVLTFRPKLTSAVYDALTNMFDTFVVVNPHFYLSGGRRYMVYSNSLPVEEIAKQIKKKFDEEWIVIDGNKSVVSPGKTPSKLEVGQILDILEKIYLKTKYIGGINKNTEQEEEK